MKQAWSTGSATLDGKHYQVDGAIVRPLPLQKGGIPFWIAGGGEKVTLKIAAQYAQYTNFAGNPTEFDAKSAILKQHCADVGTDFDAITRSSNYNVIIGSTEAEVADRVARVRARVEPFLGARTDAFMAEYAPGSMGTGTPEQIVEKLKDMQSRGMTYGIFYFPEAAYDTSGIELFEREVIPALS
jgi:alkanesulfonate monooxygenase SsuD/methylene tetrahydromethanopterin reductase-like flavin-dependent oxidoreductase (luciferase family)